MFLSGRLAVEAAKVPRLGSDLRAARAQCAESEEAGRSATAKLKLAEQELTRLRLLEQNHLTELNSLRTAEKEKVEDLSRRLTEVEKQRLALQEEVTTKSTELTATAKRWTDEIGALDRGLAGECTLVFLSLCRLSAVGCRLSLAAGSRNF
jgi:chromosome segregation ATPase